MAGQDPPASAAAAVDSGPTGGRSTRTYLIGLSLVLMVPVLLVSVWLAIGLQRSEQRRFEEAGHQAVGRAALAIELEMRGFASTIELLAASPSLAAGDLAAFRREALAAAEIEKATLVLRTLSGRQLVNTALQEGSPLPEENRLAAIDREAMRSGATAHSDYFRAVVGNEPRVAVVVPVRREGQQAYLLSAGVAVERLRNVLRRYTVEVWRLGLIDRNGVVITRVRDPDINGTRPPAVAAAAAKSERGYFEMTANDGDPSAVAFQRAANGWTVIGVASIGEFRQAQLNRIGFALAGSMALMGLGVGGAVWIANRISQPLRSLEAAGGRLSRGQDVRFLPSANAEANSVGRALSEASVALRTRERELAATQAKYKNLFEAIDDPVCLIELIRNPEGGVVDYFYLDVNPAFARNLGRDDVCGKTRREVFLLDEPSWLGVLDEVARTGRSARFEFEMKSAGRWFLAHATRLPDAVDQLAVISEDITERKRAEATRELLINELNHRVKNTLTAVLSMAMQSLKGAASLEAGRLAFTDRLLALSRAHDVLTRRSWEDAELADIIAESVRPFDRAEGRRIAAAGPAVRLTPKAALALSMVLHELATNAMKHGALSAEGGRVGIEWSVSEAWLTLVWRERGRPPVEGGRRQGFGTRLIDRSLAGDLGGAAEMDFGPDGVVCRLKAPLAGAPPAGRSPDPAQPVAGRSRRTGVDVAVGP